jgi:hypothetical protein
MYICSPFKKQYDTPLVTIIMQLPDDGYSRWPQHIGAQKQLCGVVIYKTSGMNCKNSSYWGRDGA